jgi:germination protein M
MHMRHEPRRRPATRRRRASTRALALGLLLSLAVATAGCSDDGDQEVGTDGSTPATSSTRPDGDSDTTDTTTAPSDPDGTPTTGDGTETTQLRVYLLRGEELAASGRSVPATEAVAQAAIGELLAGPTAEEEAWGLSTAIVGGTAVLGVDLDGSVATVDVSRPFTAVCADASDGCNQGEIDARLAQLVFTATQFPTVEEVVVLVEGEQLEDLSGPHRREDFTDVLPAILVESPLPGTAVESPIAVRGLSVTFEATMLWRVVDGEGATVGEGFATTGGSNGWLPFELDAAYDTPGDPAGTLVLYEASAEDGQPINVVEIPVALG